MATLMPPLCNCVAAMNGIPAICLQVGHGIGNDCPVMVCGMTRLQTKAMP